MKLKIQNNQRKSFFKQSFRKRWHLFAQDTIMLPIWAASKEITVDVISLHGGQGYQWLPSWSFCRCTSYIRGRVSLRHSIIPVVYSYTVFVLTLKMCNKNRSKYYTVWIQCYIIYVKWIDVENMWTYDRHIQQLFFKVQLKKHADISTEVNAVRALKKLLS